MICYVCSRTATHRVYADLKPVCGKHLIESVCEEDGDLLVSMIDTAPATCNRNVNDVRIEAIKTELDIIKVRKETLNDVQLLLIGRLDIPGMTIVNVLQKNLTEKQDELFAEWKKLSEENYQAFQTWFDGLGMGVSK